MAPVTPPPPQIEAMFDRIDGVLMLARALAEMRRPIDLAGLQDAVGRLCAACLDLAPEQGRALRPRLWALLAQVDALSRACHAEPER
jgi:hypothetical protein